MDVPWWDSPEAEREASYLNQLWNEHNEEWDVWKVESL
jgi:hypothetical protein